jgi:hypothetical protein
MDNLAYVYEDEQEQQGFVIDNDKLAEWALKKIAEDTADTQRLINVCDTVIAEYQFKKQQYQEKLEKKTSNLKTLLHMYFETVPHKTTKTMETYELPSGKLKLKYATQDFIRDEEKLVTWLEANDKTDLVKTKKTADWASLKKSVFVNGKNVMDEDGQIVDGVTVETKPERFEIEY